MIQGVSNSTYTTTAATTSTTAATASSTTETKMNDTAAVYEKSSDTASTTISKDNSAIVAKLKADSEANIASLKSLVEKLFTKQGQTFAWANSTSEDLMNDSSFWNAIRTGNFEADAETIAQAQADIAEDGYWGVEQTSDRMVDFAKALTGGDSSKIEEMRDAIKQGFEEAKKLWGGELPEISQKTYEATMEKLDKWAEEAGITSAENATK